MKVRYVCPRESNGRKISDMNLDRDKGLVAIRNAQKADGSEVDS